MKYIDEFRDKKKVRALVNKIKTISKKKIALMEVCGGHTMSIHKFGIPSLLPDNISLISGPGCPVCVTDRKYIDQSIAYSRMPDTIICTYGDLIRVPGSSSSLEKEKSEGKDIRIVYSVIDAINIAKENPAKNIIFLGIGFETTTPASAFGILNAEKNKINNFFVFSAHKIMPPAMEALIDENVKLNGYIAPGHVSVITGTEIYNFIAEKYKLGVAVSGFEPTDLLQSILMLVEQIENNNPKVDLQYSRAVKTAGNKKAQEAVNKVFVARDDWWRGLGVLKNSGLAVRKEYARYDAEQSFQVEVEKTKEDKACICGSILKGMAKPFDCKIFGKACTPENPVGACMVSSEGSCAAYYRYSR